MQPGSPEAVIDYLRDQLHETGDVIASWPETMRSIAPNGLLFLGIDKRNRLYWDSKPMKSNDD